MTIKDLGIFPIGVDREVYQHLKTLAKPHESKNDVIRRVFGLKPLEKLQRGRKAKRPMP